MKKLIFCFDGTANDPMDAKDFANDASISNILKLHIYFGGLSNSNKKQKSFYYQGIGTYGNWFSKTINSLFAPLEFDFRDIIASAIKDLEANWESGDEIYVFGFSRGSAIARVFCAKHIGDKKVNFLGVFDTVASIRGSRDLNKDTFPASGVLFEDANINKNILKAMHLISIDEKRIMFQPTLFNDDPRITEIYFSGVHSDIGGGYWINGLSDITIDFMLTICAKMLTVLKIDDIEFKDTHLSKDDIFINPQISSKIHTQERELFSKTLSDRKIRIQNNDKKLPLIHKSVIDRIKQNPNYKPSCLKDINFKIIDNELVVSDVCSGLRGVLDIV